jgi:hypothetical protein
MGDYSLGNLGILGAIHLVLFLIAMWEIVSGKASVPMKVLWGVIVLMLPCVGLAAYWFLGRRSMKG